MFAIDLSGKTALVTGGGQGLGAATAELLARAGAGVVANSSADGEGINRRRAHQTAGRIGRGAVAIEADVGNLEQVEAMIGQIIERFGRLDVVVHNAGLVRDRTL